MADQEVPTQKHKKADRIELAARGILAGFGAAALALSAIEDHEAIGTALVGAAIAFGLGAAFFDRLVEVSTKGVKLADLKALRAAAEQAVPEASPEEKENLVAEGSEILATRRSAGENVTPDLAVREASLNWQRNGLAVEARFASWLFDHGWTIRQGNRLAWPGQAAGQPDLVAEKDGRWIAVEVKVGGSPIGVSAVHQAAANSAAVEALPSNADRAAVQAVLVLGEVPLTKAATEAATTLNVAVYLLDSTNSFTHLLGPDLG